MISRIPDKSRTTYNFQFTPLTKENNWRDEIYLFFKYLHFIFTSYKISLHEF